ncbi:sulfatase family protein [Pontiella sulfatireligans]|uniref:Arylsulfatase n=1 Tax=Pontiella sulfatireligans TaxID=2750658 RepID=A0A6C2UGF4_9BACT|nr:arylsulfatase [Pontiella sulfatireligans]SPS74200.1 sulfatase S1_15 [Kiritimatiellales bacterium]VGO18597.1 Arylsulfatase [Pontiella sulfatireligans]
MKTVLKLMWVSALLATGVLAKEPLPNIVCILADDMGVGDIAALNPAAKVKTPNLDGLVASGMKFSDMHSSASICTPTRYSLLTGRYCWRSELKGNVLYGYSRALIAPGRDTAAALLKRNGYQTAMIGKWHLGLNWMLKDGSRVTELKAPEGIEAQIDFSKPFTGGPCDLGFDSWFGINASLNLPPYVWMENDRVVEVPTERHVSNGLKTPEEKQVRMESGLQASGFDPSTVLKTLTERAVEHIDAADAESPFFLYLPLTAPHTPVVPRDEFRGTSDCGIYGDFVQEIDWSVGQVLDALEARGIAENTLVIFTADNGASKPAFPLKFEQVFDHHPSGIYRGRKASLYEGGHRVPFLVRWPEVVEAGSRCDVLCELTDFYATCAELVRAPAAPQVGEDSFSMLPLFFQTLEKYKRTQAVHHDFGGRFAFRDGRWKLIPSKNRSKAALYDLEADVSETANQYASNPEVVERLEARLTAVVANGRSTPGPKQENDGPAWWSQLVWMEQK